MTTEVQTASEYFDIDAIRAELAEDRIVTTNAQLDDALQPIVDDAGSRGMPDLQVVVLDKTPETDTLVRDLATTIGQETGGTVVVRSPMMSGSYSESFSRSALESGELAMMDEIRYPEGLDAFIHTTTTHFIPWSEINYIALGVVMVLAVTLPLVWWLRARRAYSR
ncbi:hypothetical protein KRX51_05835 [Corynebacterium sp. TAE3-ERU12]|uniref:Rv1476 family membrane protein n=1 Tax=Corynebacterium sp. TAE3-ERU12 TaxID=2849491 RepID=UPI001C47E596|nr:DUF6676 family protein [Corynebacterium sp. TAE3-ERU12]MBV7295439.1 hypothetical protein [Corynebacterium sp. TAE3-ERU12]